MSEPKQSYGEQYAHIIEDKLAAQKEIIMDLLWQTCGGNACDACQHCDNCQQCFLETDATYSPFNEKTKKALAYAVKQGWIRKEQVIR